MVYKYSKKGINYCKKNFEYYPLLQMFIIISCNDTFIMNEYIQKMKDNDDNRLIASFFNICGDIFKQNDDVNASIKCYEESILFYDIEYTKDVEPSLINLAQLYEIVGDYKKASIYYYRHYRDFKVSESLLYAILLNSPTLKV